MELARGKRLGQYQLLTCIGMGGMAQVWIARTVPKGGEAPRLVAIKSMLPHLTGNMKFRAMFLEEGQTVRSIEHENVVRVYDVAEAAETLFMAMEWIEGDSLHAVMTEASKRRPIPAELAARVIADAAKGLHAAHETRGWDGELKNLVHCDISPHNILVGLDGVVRIVDFGVANAVDSLAFDEPGTIRGKFGYMSPEQTRGEKLDRRSDIFSLGIVLFELTTGHRLFKGADPKQTVDLVRRARIPLPSELMPGYPKGLEAIIEKALQRDRDERFSSAEEMANALDQFLVDVRVVVPRSGVAGLLRRVLRERIDDRRASIRQSVTELDGTSEPGLVPVRPAAAELFDESTSGSQASAVRSVTGSESFGAARLSPSDPTAAPQTLQKLPSRDSSPKRQAVFGLSLVAMVLGGLLLWKVGSGVGDAARAAVLDEGNSARAVAEQRAAGQPPAQDEKARDESAKDDGATSLDSLPAVDEEGDKAAQGGSTSKARSRSRSTPGSKNVVKRRSTKSTKSTKSTEDTKTNDDPLAKVRRDASIALGGAANQAGLCRRPGGETGRGKVQVTFAPSGKVASAQLVGKFGGSAVGRCVLQKFQRASIASFSGAPVTVLKSFVVPD